MKPKDDAFYEKQIEELKKEREQVNQIDFGSSKERKKAKEDLKRQRRAIKRSQKQQVRKLIEQEIEGEEND